MDDPRQIIQQVAAQHGIGDYAWIPLTISYGESGLQPDRIWSDPTPTNPGATAGGLFAYHDDGRGKGWGEMRKDPWAITQDVMPAMAQAIQDGVGAGLSGYDLLRYVWYAVERPAQGQATEQNMQNAFQAMGGENMPGSNPFPYGSGEGNVSAGGPGPQPFIGGASDGLPPGYKLTPIRDAQGHVIQNILEWQEEMTLPDGTTVKVPKRQLVGTKTPDTDTPAQSTNAAANMLGSQASMMSARAQRLNAIMNGYAELIKATGLPREQAMAQFKAAIEQATLEQSQGRDNLNRANYEETARRERETSEAGRRVRVAEEAGRRAETVSKNILPFLVQGATSMNLPMLGQMPLTQVNPDQLFSQGGVGDLGLLPTINPNPSVTFPGAPPLNLPPMPQPAPVPDFQTTINSLLPYL